MLRYLFTIILIMSLATCFAQSKKKKAEKVEATSTGQPSSLEPYYPKKDYEPKKKKSSAKVTYNATEKFYDRREELGKQERRNEKELEKPENSNPLYFGHKRPPKKRPVHKMKYCKVCGIRH